MFNQSMEKCFRKNHTCLVLAHFANSKNNPGPQLGKWLTRLWCYEEINQNKNRFLSELVNYSSK